MSKNKETTNWWFSPDNRRGFNWDEVVGYDYRQGGKSIGFAQSQLYIYLKSAILTLHALEADAVFAQIKDRGLGK
jgi:hypothetical protein